MAKDKQDLQERYDKLEKWIRLHLIATCPGMLVDCDICGDTEQRRCADKWIKDILGEGDERV